MCAARTLAVVTWLGASLFGMRGAAADSLRQLSEDSRARIARGEQVVYEQTVKGSHWPALTIYQVIRATPEEAAAVFTDYGGEAGYLESCCGIVKSVVTDPAVGGDPRARLVYYEQRVPALSNERYTLLEVMSRGADGSFAVTWRKFSGQTRAADIVGHASLEPFGTNTLLVYYNFTDMPTFGSGLFAGRYVARTERTLVAMRAHMEQLAAQGGAPLQSELSRLHRAFEARGVTAPAS